MHTLYFTLKQHTPLIHFHDQDEATLRATEVKPKLDKYLIKVMGGEEASRIYDKWEIQGDVLGFMYNTIHPNEAGHEDIYNEIMYVLK